MRQPIHNCADDGRPDVWQHTASDIVGCDLPTPPDDIEAALERETRTIVLRLEELITYEIELKAEVHTGVPRTALLDYLADNEDLWGDHVANNFFSATDRDILPETCFTDDAGYLEALDEGIDEHPEKLQRWLTAVCPVCGLTPSSDDTTHQTVATAESAAEGTEQKVTGVIAITCTGYRVVDPNLLGIMAPYWKDWTADAPVANATIVEAPSS
ncbi:hypothetical protein OG339_48620 (plasmid) [Streptosporangium sp. NBC_01495]|uniref:hypothetical protein n=1 Tax=Streptosporangium sp. NBC_01495 TaxID=2903899 RepID=UPI002E2F324E|nr:hypothetical protein [Streptosporangium sp. NBC_01495]